MLPDRAFLDQARDCRNTNLMWRRGIVTVVIVVWGLTLLVTPTNRAKADEACTATISRHSFAPYQTQPVNVTVTNTGDAVIRWIRFTPPNVNFEPREMTANNWSITINSYFAELDDGSLPPSA